MTTTNDLLSKVIEDLQVLVEWAQADMEQAKEFNYKADLNDAAHRYKILSECKNKLNDNCYK